MTAARSRELCIMACVFCRDTAFQQWAFDNHAKVAFVHEVEAKRFILTACQVTSRNELDTTPSAAELFHTMVRLPFLAWKEAQP